MRLQSADNTPVASNGTGAAASRDGVAPDRGAIQAWLAAQIAELVGVEPGTINVHDSFDAFGLSSREAVSLSGDLEEWLGRQLSPTLVYEYPTIAALARYLAGDEASATLTAPAEEMRQPTTEPIAIIGIGCRFPGADGPEAFWQLLCDGVDAISEAPADRWDMERVYSPTPGAPGKLSTRWGGFLQDVDQFDAGFFGISPREARAMDPQQRLLLEVVWEALEDAGTPPDRVAGTETGVFIGISSRDYSILQHGDPLLLNAYSGTGNAFSIAANRLSYIFDFRGPSVAVDTACSSALVALHLACQSLRDGEAQMALAGGVNLILAPDVTIAFSQARMMAPDGRCKTFDADADGYVRSEGCGVVVLKRISDALRDGDQVLALIRGTAVNQDGRSNGLTAPNGMAQQEVVRAALRNGGVRADQIDYVEAHGTGTMLGDPIEARALGAVLNDARRMEPCLIGSVKTNIGHAEAASGIAGLIKVVLALKHELIPPHLHLRQLNPHIVPSELGLEVTSEARPWPAGARRRYAGVSSFGFGGTNAHAILEDAPPHARIDPVRERPRHLLTLAAKDETALRVLAGRYAAHLARHPGQSLADVCFTANRGRAGFAYRLAATAEDAEELTACLTAFAEGQPVTTIASAQLTRVERPQIAFLFTGQGAQYAGMGRELYATQPTFRAALDHCAELLAPHMDRPLLDILLAEGDDSALINETAYTQPALFALEYALARMWMAWGVTPDYLLGHSVGEYVAACIAGVFTLEDGLKLIAARGRLMQALPRNGTMATVFAELARVQAALAPYAGSVAIAGINGPASIAVSGEAAAVATLLERLAAEGIEARPLVVSHAFHSPLMDPILEEFEAIAREVTFNPPLIPLVANLTGAILDATTTPDAAYWRQHLREAVQFLAGMEALAAQGCDIFLEIGPAPVLTGMGRRCLPEGDYAWLPSLRQQQPDWQILLDSLGALYLQGAPIDWVGFDRDYPRSWVRVPTYPFQRERCWFETTHSANGAGYQGVAALRQDHPLLGLRLRSPLATTLFEGQVGVELLPYLADHRVQGSVVLPAAAYLELALAAATSRFGAGAHTIAEVTFQQALFLAAEARHTLQAALDTATPGAATFQVFSLSGADASQSAWTLHSAGTIRPVRDEDAAPAGGLDLAELQARCSEVIAGADYYALLREQGLDYGPAFQGVARLWRGDGAALGQLRALEEWELETTSYHLHPALLDSCFHVLGAALAAVAQDDGGVYLPVGAGSLRLHGRPGGSLWSYATLHGAEGADRERPRGDVLLLDGDGNLLAEVRDLRLQRVGRAAQAAQDDWLYALQWEAQPLVAPEAGEAGSWLICADSQGVGAALAAALEAQGQTAVLVGADAPEGANGYQVDPLAPESFTRLLNDLAAAYGPWRGVVHLWGLDAPSTATLTLDNLNRAQILGPGSALHLVQALDAAGWDDARLWLVTQGAQAVGAAPVSVAQAPLWGLGRVVAQECPTLHCACVDLDPGGPDVAALCRELLAADSENQVALRGDERYVARLLPYAPEPVAEVTSAPADQRLAIPRAAAYRLEAVTPGTLDGLALTPCPHRYPAPHEVEIEVRATGLNFRDVLCAMGLYPEGPIPLGSECAGVISAVGENVEGLHVGDEVIAIAPYSFGAYTLAAWPLVAPKPSNVGFAEAATIPITFLTAYYALHHLGRMEPGERVLIHAAAGGVGLAAVQIAQMRGAEIFATAGSAEKRAFLEGLGVQHVLDSRTLAFADEIMARTNGQGVDLVLNSLAGEAIPRSLGVLGAYGRFLEIGKTDIYQNSRIGLYPFHNNLSYFAIDLDRVAREKPALIRALFLELMQHFVTGALRPLPLTVFPLPEAVAAFRYMAQRKNIGKIVVTAAEHGADSPADGGIGPVRADATYLVTGGLGALGLVFARWLADQGARSLALMGRSAPSAEAEALIADLRRAGVAVTVVQADVAAAAEVGAALEALAATQPPLRGVIHAAGLLDDGALHQLDIARLDRVMRPKVQGAWNLHLLTRDRPLDFFVLFSSVAAIFGSPGQSNYAAANAFLDALAHQRRSTGLPALSINWGPWAEVGMAARTSGGAGVKFRGIAAIAPQQGVETLGRLLEQDAGQVMAAPVAWDQLLRLYPAAPPLLAHFAAERAAATERDQPGDDERLTGAKLRAAPPDQQQELIETYLRNQIGRVLGVDPARLAADQALNTLGLDSIMAIELKNGIEANLGVNLPIVALLQGPTTVQLATQIAAQIQQGAGGAAVAPALVAAEDEEAVTEGPLSYGQRAMWFQHQVAPESIYNLIYAVHSRARIDVSALQAAFQRLVDRHPALRTTFSSRAGEPVQIIHDHADVCFSHEDVAHLSQADFDARLRTEVHTPFDLEHGPLLRVYLFSRGAEDHTLLLAAHHIVVDLWSQAIITYEASLLFETGGKAQLPELHLTYADYVRWQSEMLEGPVGEQLWRYWQRQLRGDLPLLNLPTDRPRPAVQTFKGATQQLRLDAALTQRLKAVAEQQGATLYMTLLAAFKVLLYRYSGQTDLIVGTPTTGRSREELSGLVGYFVNPVPIRTELAADMPFAAYLAQVRQTVLEAIEHQDFPIAQLVERLQPVRDASRTPLFQVMFVLQRAHLLDDAGLSNFALGAGGQMMLAGLPMESVPLEQQVSPFDLTMMMAEGDDAIGASISYNVDLFDAATIGAMLGHFRTLLEGVAADAQAEIGGLPLLTPAEMQRVLIEFNATSAELPIEQPVHLLFEAQAARSPEAPALVSGDATMTYAELNARANQLAHYLREQGIGPETLVGIYMERSLELIIAVLGVLKAGGAYVPLDPIYPQERLAAMVADARPRLVLHDGRNDAAVRQPGAEPPHHLVSLADWTALAGQPATNPVNLATADNLAYVIYTSGSTGRPKGVLALHRGVCNLALSQIAGFGVTAESRVLQFASFSFDASVSEIFMALLTGASLHLASRDVLLSGAGLLQLLRDQAITTVTLPPSLLAVLAPDDLPGLQTVISAGESCPVEIAARWSAGRRFINAYGPTEATIGPTMHRVESLPAGMVNVPIGRPIANTQVYLLDANRQPVPVGVPGEIYIGGVGVARGYLNRPDLTAEKFVPNPFGGVEHDPGRRATLYRTGDLARCRPDGALEYLGRVDQQVKIRGFRVEPGEIEAVLAAHPALNEVAVVARNDGPGGARLVAYVVSNGQSAGLADDSGAAHGTQLRRFLQERLPDYMVPAFFVPLERMPLTPNGKIDRKALPSPQSLRLDLATPYVMPQTEIERRIAAIWQEALQVERVGLNDNFFDLGGHSLLLIRVHSALTAQFQRDIPLVDLFRHPTVATQAAYLSREDNGQAALQASKDRAARQREALQKQRAGAMARRRT